MLFVKLSVFLEASESESALRYYIRNGYATCVIFTFDYINIISRQCPEILLGNEMEDTYQVAATRLLLEQRFDLHCHGEKSSGSNSSRVFRF